MARPGVFIIALLILFAAWVVLELAVIAFYRFGLVPWLILHAAFLLFASGLLAGLNRVALDAIDGRDFRLRDLTRSLRSGPAFLLAGTIYLIAVVGGLLFLIVPGIHLAGRYALFGPALASRPTSAMTALTAAGRLSQGHWWNVFAVLLLAFLFNLLGAAFLGIGLLFTFPITVLAVAGLYRSLDQATL